jgi:hypothetical protein
MGRLGQGKGTRGAEVGGVVEVAVLLGVTAEVVEGLDKEIVVNHEERRD